MINTAQWFLICGIIVLLSLEYQWIMQLHTIAPRMWGAILYLSGSDHRARDYLYVQTWFKFGLTKADQLDVELAQIERKQRRATQ